MIRHAGLFAAVVLTTLAGGQAFAQQSAAEQQMREVEQRQRDAEARQRFTEMENRQNALEQTMRSNQVQADLNAQAARGQQIHRDIDALNTTLALDTLRAAVVPAGQTNTRPGLAKRGGVTGPLKPGASQPSQ